MCMCINAGPQCPCLIAAGLTETVANSYLSFYPNPTHSELLFKGNIHSIIISDVTGREMYRYEDDKQPTATHIKTLNIASYPAGIYMVRLNGGEMRKLVKE